MSGDGVGTWKVVEGRGKSGGRITTSVVFIGAVTGAIVSSMCPTRTSYTLLVSLPLSHLQSLNIRLKV